jgi:hypothetical protein
MADTVRTTETYQSQPSFPWHFPRRASWGAIFAGIVLVLAFELIFATLGAAIGLTYIEPQTKDTSASAAMKVSFFWWLITSLISLFLGSIAAGKLSGSWSRCSASLHGLVVWAGTTLVTLFLLTSAIGTIIGGAFSIIGTSVKAVTSAVQKVAPSIGEMAGQMMPDMSKIGKDVNDVISDPNQRGELADALKNVLAKGKNASEDDREAVVKILSQKANMTHDEAEQKLDSWIQSYSQTKEQVKQAIPEANEKAMQVAGKAANIGADAAWFAFIMLILGAFVSALGGLIGTPCCCHGEEKTGSRTVRKVPE